MQRTMTGLVVGALLCGGGVAGAQPAAPQPATPQAATPQAAAPQAATVMGSGVAQFTLAPSQPPSAITPSGAIVPAASASTSADASATATRFLLRFNLGVSAMRLNSPYQDGARITSSGAELNLDVGVRLHERFGVGGHAGILTGLSWKESYWDDLQDDVAYYGVSSTPMELGASLHFFPTDRLWISPWAGLAALGRGGGTQGAVGLSAGVDLVASDLGHRLGLYAQGLRTSGYENEGGGLRSFSLGATYSFR